MYLSDRLDKHGECGDAEDEVEEELDHGGDVHRLLVEEEATALVDRRQQEDDRHRGEARGLDGKGVDMVDVIC